MQPPRTKLAPQATTESNERALIAPGHTAATVSDQISQIVLKRGFRKSWLLGLAASFVLVMVLMVSVGYLFLRGVGIWGVNVPVAWGFAIVNFVWWIGIGHAGTFISAFLLLVRQPWRTSINRFAEAMTLFAVACAGIYPILHLGRPQIMYWLMPYPSTLQVWPNFRSPLVWDVFAVSTYALVSLMFWFVGLVPDLAVLRDRSKTSVGQKFYGLLAMGWRGSARHWQRYETAYFLLAALAAPLVISVHTIVSLDFTAAQVPGWHSTIFPPFFVAGAIYSGFAMVLTLAIPLRKIYKLQDFIRERHLVNCAKLLLVTGLIVAYGYLIEIFMAWYSGDPYERYLVVNRALGPYALAYWALIICNIGIPQLLWFAKIRSNPLALWVLAIIINIGMWLERFVIVVVSLHRDFLPSSWGMYRPTFWDYSTFLGTFGLFFFLFLLFIRLLPAISISEMQKMADEESA